MKNQPMTEIEDIKDTIEVAKQYLADSKSHSGGPLAYLFDSKSIEFAKSLIKFEMNRLRELENS